VESGWTTNVNDDGQGSLQDFNLWSDDAKCIPCFQNLKPKEEASYCEFLNCIATDYRDDDTLDSFDARWATRDCYSAGMEFYADMAYNETLKERVEEAVFHEDPIPILGSMIQEARNANGCPAPASTTTASSTKARRLATASLPDDEMDEMDIVDIDDIGGAHADETTRKRRNAPKEAQAAVMKKLQTLGRSMRRLQGASETIAQKCYCSTTGTSSAASQWALLGAGGLMAAEL
jgi:hypothetical protein